MRLSFFALTFLLLAGCSSRPDLPDFTASGYLADRGTVRIWRKNSTQKTWHLMAVYTPFSGGATETTDYLWQADKLIAFERHTAGQHPGTVTLRFDQDGGLSFMERQTDGRREALSADDVALYQFDAERMLKISDDLLAGRVLLKQGRWLASGKIMRCDGVTDAPDFDNGAMVRQQRRTGAGVAWLEAPSGIQMLQISIDDPCATEPKEAEF
ncbi:DUF1481 domain-containing protein [Erwinia oleae]|uniref:DUF1481 domain-containing protein n=1 Tax=Erwinia oleae TaxID=796334 RepID=UPI00054D0712|nr:DUF1481 domain-containing protein [Erwinia oleae]